MKLVRKFRILCYQKCISQTEDNTDNIPTTYRPLLPTTYRPHTDRHYRPPLSTSYRPHIERLCRPRTDHIPTTCRPHTDHVPTTYRQINLFTITGVFFAVKVRCEAKRQDFSPGRYLVWTRLGIRSSELQETLRQEEKTEQRFFATPSENIALFHQALRSHKHVNMCIVAQRRNMAVAHFCVACDLACLFPCSCVWQFVFSQKASPDSLSTFQRKESSWPWATTYQTNTQTNKLLYQKIVIAALLHPKFVINFQRVGDVSSLAEGEWDEGEVDRKLRPGHTEARHVTARFDGALVFSKSA